jgi:hypothetical protein
MSPKTPDYGDYSTLEVFTHGELALQLFSSEGVSQLIPALYLLIPNLSDDLGNRLEHFSVSARRRCQPAS